MPDDQQEYNCALGICCGDEVDGGKKQLKAVASIVGKTLGHRPMTLENVATAIVKSFDLAEKDTLKAFKDSVARFARSNPYV